MRVELTDRESQLNGGLMDKTRLHSSHLRTMKKPDARMHCRSHWGVTGQRKKTIHAANNDRRIDVHRAQKARHDGDGVWYRARGKKASSFFIVRVVGSGYAFVITLSGSTCGLWVFTDGFGARSKASPSRRLMQKGGKEKKIEEETAERFFPPLFTSYTFTSRLFFSFR